MPAAEYPMTKIDRRLKTKTDAVRRISPLTMADLAGKAKYRTLEDIFAAAFDDMRPPGRMSVTEAAEKFTKIGSAGGSKPWLLGTTPYLELPQDVMTSLEFQGMIFVGPARTGKTVMGLNWITHTVKTDPADMLFVHMDRENARKWSKGDLDRFLIASPDIRSEQVTTRQYDNTFDKTFKSGMRFLLTYPTASNLSGITVGRVMFIDYDRSPNNDNVDGEGNAYDLGSMRTTTFRRFAMTGAESSPNPNKEITDPRWMPNSPHEAPPIKGIFELYNRGDRRRWQWCCPSCEEWFEPDFKLLDWNDLKDPMEAKEATVMICPHHGCVLKPWQKDSMNRTGRWIREGEYIEPGLGGETKVRPGMKVTRSTIASFWLKGPAAAYQDWGNLVEKYVRAVKTFDDTGDDGPLRKTITTDQGNFYIPYARLSDIAPESLKAKAEDWGSTRENPTVPEDVRFLVATVDVQNTCFVVQVTGFTSTGDAAVIDMFKIRLSNRLNDRDERLPVDPAAFGEDWFLIEQEVMNRTYELADGSGRHMRIRATGCDSGGKEGVTGHAYNFWRALRQRKDGSHRKLILLKGEPSKTIKQTPEARTSWPDSSQKDQFAVARGDVPVVLLNSNKLKDRVNLLMHRRLAAEESEGGMLRYSDWCENWFYTQLTSEVRTEKGWEKTGKRRNEAFDLTYYALAVVLRGREKTVPYLTFTYDRIDWAEPPFWADEWDENELVFMPEVLDDNQNSTSDRAGEPQQSVEKPKKLSMKELAERLA